jgi:hypothetical protein
MRWPFVSRLRLEALEDKYDELVKINDQLKEHADKLLDSILQDNKDEREAREQQPDPVQQPRRLLSKDIRERATAAADKRFHESPKGKTS